MGKTTVLSNMKGRKKKITTTTITKTVTMISIITIIAYCNNSTDFRVYNANLPQYLPW